MASTRKSQLVLTCNAQAIKDVFDYLNKELGRIKLRRDALLRQFEGKMWTADAKREFKQLGDDIAAITSMQQKNEEEMRKYGQVMADLAGSKLRDMKGAVREVTSALNKMTENDPNRRKLIDDLAKLKNEIAVIGGNRRSLNEVTNDLKNLSNVRFDHLTQDLEAVRARYAQLSEAERQSAKGLGLKNAEQLLQAQIGVAQYGRAGSGAIVGTDRDKAMAMDSKARQEAIIQLQQEQQRLRSLYQATDGAKGFEIINKESLDRLHQVNQAVTNLTEAERKYVQTQREESARNEMLAKENEIIDRIKKGQKVTLEELIELQKHYKSELEKSQGLNITDPNDIAEVERLNKNLRITEDHIRKIRAEAGGEVMKNANYAASNLGSVSIDQLADISKRGKELFSVMKPSDSGYDQLKADLIAIDAELERVTPKWNELATEQQKTAQTTDVLTRLLNSQKVSLSELTETQKNLEAQIKKMEGTNLSVSDQLDLDNARRDLEAVKKAIGEISLSDLDFDALDDVPVERLEQALKQLEEQEKKLAAADTAAAKVIANNKEKINEQLRKVRKNNENVARAQKIVTETGKHSVSELKAAYETLQQRLLSLNTGQKKEIRETQLQMKKLKGAIDEVTQAASKQNSVWSTAVKNITAYVGVFGMFNMIKNKLQEILKLNLAFSDQLADIRKVSGLAMSDINQLAKGLAKIDTRTSLEDLSKISYAGAKLGMAQYGIGGLEAFTNAANQLNVALKEDLGDEALTAVAKLTENMGLIKNMGVEKAMLSTSSAIFKLAATSTAAGGPIVEFSKRLAAVAGQAGITTDQLLGMASASDSMMLMPEVASTAFNKMITAMQTNHNLIEKQLGITKGTINELFSQGRMMDAMVLVFERMKELGNMNALKPIFKDLGSDGARLNMVMTAMAKNVDMLKDHLYVAEESFRQATAVTEEYNIQQETAQAIMERASNMWNKAFMNPEGVDLAKQFAQAWYDITESLTQSTGAIWTIANALKMLFGVLKLFVDLIPAFMSAGAAWGVTKLFVKISETAKTAGGMVTALTTAVRGLSLATKMATGFGIFVASLELLVYALGKAKKETEDLALSQEDLHDALSRGTMEANKATTHLNSYKNILEDVNTTEDDRARILKKFNYEYRGYLNKLGIEVKSVADLATAYKALNEELRKERYYQMQNALIEEKTSPIIRKGADATTRFNTAMGKYGGAAGFDATYIREHQDEGAAAIYKRIIEAQYGSGGKWNEENGHYTVQVQFQEGGKKYDIEHNADRTLATAISDMIMAFREEADVTKQVKESFKPYVGDYDPTMQQLLGELENEAPDKDAARAAKKAEADHKQAIRKELQDAKQESDAIIAKIEEWYRLQETVVTGFAADGKWTQQQAEMVNRELEAAKNEALANARLAISGRDTQTWEQTKESLRVMMFDTGQWSQELFQQMMDVSMAAIRQNLSRIDKEGGQYGITTSSLKDGLDKNAAGNRRKVQELRNKTAKEVEKMLLQFNYFEQAAKAYEDRLTQLGLLTETAEQAADRIRKASGSLKAGNKTEEQLTAERSAARRQAGLQFLTQSAQQNYTVDYENTADLNKWLMDFTGAQAGMGANGFEFQFSGWAEAFKDEFNKWLKDSETYKADIQAFYLSLIDFDKQYFDSVKNYRQKMNENFQQRWDTSGRGQAYADAASQLDLKGRRQRMMGEDQGTNFAQMGGFVNTTTDPELEASMLRMQQMQEELEMFKMVNEQKKLEGAELLAYQQGLAEKQRAVDEAEMAMQEALMNHINEHITKLAQWTAPIEQFGADVGDAMGKALFESENMADGMRNALKSLVKSWGESTIQIVKQLMMQQLKQKLIGKTMVKDKKKTEGEMSDTVEEGEKERFNVTSTLETGAANIMQQVGDKALATKQTQDAAQNQAEAGKAQGSVLAGIAEGAAKIIGMLGPFGAPLIAVITALLMGLLNTALAALTGGGGDKGNNANQANRKIKLAQGMLTYDEGNVQTVVGDDGRVYRAREQRSLPEGVSMVTEPIATRVNGQQALVGERGPEIVIGRRTTRAIQMNRPDLLRDLALIDRGITTRKVRTFDEGNISDMATAFAGQLPAPQQSADGQQGGGEAQRERDRAMLATLGVLSQTIGQLQQQLAAGIHAELNMYGDNGAYKKFQQADRYYKKYGG